MGHLKDFRKSIRQYRAFTGWRIYNRARASLNNNGEQEIYCHAEDAGQFGVQDIPDSARNAPAGQRAVLTAGDFREAIRHHCESIPNPVLTTDPVRFIWRNRYDDLSTMSWYAVTGIILSMCDRFSS
jgi:hypothetical protein